MLSAFCVGSVEEIEKETSEKIEPSCDFIFRHTRPNWCFDELLSRIFSNVHTTVQKFSFF